MGLHSQPGLPPSRSSRLLRTAWSLLKGWLISITIFGLLSALTAYAWTTSFRASTDPVSINWAEVARRGYRDWLPWAFVAPFLFQLVSRLPIFGGRWKLAFPLHVLFAVATFALCSWWGETGATLLWPATFGPLRENRWGGPRRPPEQRPPRPPEANGNPSAQPPNWTNRGGGGGGGRPPGGPPQRGRSYFDPFFLLTFRLPIYLALLSVAHALVFYQRFQIRERRSLELESGLARARLDALRMQLQPHFLFNSLNAIAALIHKDPEAADEMVAALSDFLRLTLESSSEQELPLGRELEFVERYLAIEKVRFGDRLQFSIDTPVETLPALVPALVLQPLVENAVRHGLEPKVLGGTLTITARHQGTNLVLTVRDDGAGLHQKTPHREGIGLVNTRARLGELYGTGATLEMRNGDGVRVEITLPFHTTASAA